MTSLRFRDWRVGLAICLLAFTCLGCPESGRVVGEVDAENASPAAAEQTTSVGHILGDPAAFAGRDVTVTGLALPGLAFEFINEQPYQLDDGSGVIWVVTPGTVPAADTRVTIRGKVAAPYQIKGRSYEVVILEQVQSP